MLDNGAPAFEFRCNHPVTRMQQFSETRLLRTYTRPGRTRTDLSFAWIGGSVTTIHPGRDLQHIFEHLDRTIRHRIEFGEAIANPSLLQNVGFPASLLPTYRPLE
jgi:hypothetical protein